MPLAPSIQAARHRRDRQAGQAQHERRRDPVDVGLHRLAGDRVRIVLLDRKRRHGHARRDDVIEAREELAEAMPEAALEVLGRRQVARGDSRPARTLLPTLVPKRSC